MAIVQSMIRWCVAALLEKRGWTAYRLAKESGLSIPLSYRVAASEPIQRIDAGTLDTLCVLFDVQPGDLLEWVPDRPKGGKR